MGQETSSRKQQWGYKGVNTGVKNLILMHPQVGFGAALAHPVGVQVGSAPTLTLKWNKSKNSSSSCHTSYSNRSQERIFLEDFEGKVHFQVA